MVSDTACLMVYVVNQRRRRYFKSGQATANKRSVVHVHLGGGVYNRQCVGSKTTCGIKMQQYKKH